MNLHEKILSTAPGKHAEMLRDLLYYKGLSLGDDWSKEDPRGCELSRCSCR